MRRGARITTEIVLCEECKDAWASAGEAKRAFAPLEIGAKNENFFENL